MRILMIVAWLTLPVIAAAWHYGPGQDYLKTDAANDLVKKGDAAVKAEDFAKAVEFYDNALKQLPAGNDTTARRIRLEKNKAMMLCRRLPEAYADLQSLVEELQDPSKNTDTTLLADARSTLAGCQYYATWGMRLEGLPRDQWEPEIENSRQLYKLLAEECEAKGDAATAQKHREDLEAAVRLARLSDDELQALPLPKQCNCKCSSCCNGKGKCKGKNPGKSPSDSKARGASSGPPPDNSGH
jgi:tetratricopeptide (TPR) repeat protein